MLIQLSSKYISHREDVNIEREEIRVGINLKIELESLTLEINIS